VDGVLDADAIAAAYREAGFEDPAPVSGPPPEATDPVPLAERPDRPDRTGHTKELPADRDGGSTR
jgi:hypothetical protein